MKIIKEKVESTKPSEILFYGMIFIIGIAVLLTGYAAGRSLCLKEARKTYNVTVKYLKSQCGEYDNFIDNDEVKSLFRITEQADDIGRTLDILPDSEEDGWLKEYTQTQRLTSVILTDENSNVTADYTLSELEAETLMANLPRDAVKQIIEYPVKIYSDRIDMGDGIFDIAAAARHDKKGLVLCFRLQDEENMNNYYSSVQNLIAGSVNLLNGTSVITDGDKIISSNGNGINGKKGSLEVLSLIDKKAETGDIVKISVGKSDYYGGKAAYKSYGIYVFYPSSAVFEDCFNTVLLSLCIYSVIIVFVIAFHQRSKILHAREVDEQFEIIRTISRMFLFNIYVDLKKNRFKFLIREADFAYVDENRSAEDVLATDFTNYAAEQYREEYRKFSDISTVKQRLKNKEYIEIEYRNIHGEWLNDIIIPKRTGKNGDFDSFLLVTKNINEQKKTELEYQQKLEEAVRNEMRANEAKTNLLRRMSHDIRTPINAILGMIEIADRSAGDYEKINYCRNQSRLAAEYLLELVNDILTLNRIEFDNKTEVNTSFALKDEVAKIFTIVNIRAENAGVTLNPPQISVSGRRLYGNVLFFHQIVINILTNAVKYSTEGGKVDFSFTEEQNGDGALIRFICADGGIGMSREFQKKMFEPFAQENADEAGPYGGLGLGLAIVKMLTEKLGGRLSVQSEKGKGTEFETELPFRYSEEPELPPEPENYSIKGLKLLIAEDNRINMEIAEYLARDAGAITVTAFDGREAIDIFAASAENEFDAILMDITMPVLDGLKATERIRALKRADAKTVPIIAMTANLFIQDIEKCFGVGMNGYLAKPIDEKQLIRIIAKKCAERNNNEA